jgi:predicted nucleotidyltransferase
MERMQVVRLLTENRRAIQERGAKSLAVFGSFARDDSDVDIMVGFDTPPTFDVYMNLKFYLEELLGRKVDLVPKRTLKARIRSAVEREAIHVA